MTEKTAQEIIDLLILNGRKPEHIKNDERVVYLADAIGIVRKALDDQDQPTFTVGEYYFDKDANRIVRIAFTEKGYTEIEYLTDGVLLNSVLYNLADYFDKWTQATAEQIATFKRTEQFAAHGRKLDEEG